MTKEEIISYLTDKQQLTAKVQDLRHDIYVLQTQSDGVFNKYKKHRNIFVVVMLFILFMVDNVVAAGIILAILLGGYIWLRMQRSAAQGKLNTQIDQVNQQIANEQAQPDYLAGLQDFPREFYSYWTIDRLIHLVQENRATTLQEAFNVAENQNFQNDQLALQQQNLAVAESTNSAAKVSAAANVFTAMNTRK
ncbi:MAG: hypothetical protein LKH74_07785 [Levilactobacillus sp.]|jgi:uncharacterized membrane protein YciS (DUF1049 family)|uniref:Uncharacterized protein n=1 Tax=Levilactobacillus suantsaiihabitans TaxID=2487722 RepID=A0A4Z0JCH7_9LACO|nr:MULTISPECIES: hypothetical protein [Levilactobacillus]MCH4123718.1 hypothetical protein [Levilactobacillus sp.]MCI1553816.1 hypothetical protein [Levilactobacillus sp.]MCI1599102.1 hypothetical protein [Levilactobacillus sp.]MCI1606339.1 hypothetical protein [Levilactobacillus sp.]TGD19457.1 hypothetical protein EGT51_04615 [Levilactobacillus suantsaiihabitans]